MSKLQILRAFVNQRLTSAVEEIFVLFERTITEYEDEVSRSKEENERQRKLLDAVLSPEVRLHRAGVQRLLQQEWSPSMDHKDQEPPHDKEHQEEFWRCQEGAQPQDVEEVYMIKFPSTPVTVKSESDEEEAQFSQLHQDQTEDSREAEPLASRSTEVDLGFSMREVQQLLIEQEWGSSVKQEDPQSPYIKEDQEELWSRQEEEHLQGPEEADTTNCSSTPVTVKGESDEEETQFFEFHQSQTERSRKTEPPTSCSTEQMKTESEGEDCEGPEPARVLGPASEDKDSDSGEKPFRCHVCSKRFPHKSHLIVHMRIHSGEKPFSCSVCGEGFVQKGTLTRHMRIHTGEKPFSCSVCGKRFTQQQSLTVHMKLHSTEKPFKCSVCQKGFKLQNYLMIHMKSHTGEKPFSCSVCGKRFTQKCNLTAHMRLHSGEKPFRCSVCGKGFTQKGHLSAHMRLHSGEKPFRCSVCDEGFTHKQTLTIHMRLHSGENIVCSL